MAKTSRGQAANSGKSPEQPVDAGQPTAERAPTKKEQAQADTQDHVDQRERLSESLD